MIGLMGFGISSRWVAISEHTNLCFLSSELRIFNIHFGVRFGARSMHAFNPASTPSDLHTTRFLLKYSFGLFFIVTEIVQRVHIQMTAIQLGF